MRRSTASTTAALLAAVACAAPGIAVAAATVQLTAPVPGTTVPGGSAQTKIPLVALTEIPGAHEKDPILGPAWVRFSIECTECVGGIVLEPPLATLPIVRAEITVGDLRALASAAGPGHALHVRWWVDAGWQKTKDKEGFFTRARGAFTVAAAPNLAVSAESDFGSPWPKDVLVRNTGGSKSQASSLEVDFKLRDASDPAVKSRCPAADYHKVHTVLALDPDAKAIFDVPKPAGAPPAGHPGGVHKFVTCNYLLDAVLSQDTNKADPNAANDRLHKVVSVDVPLN